jgi:putative transcription factor
MAVCEMCGQDSYLRLVNVDGAELNVCKNCAKYGEVKKKKVFKNPANNNFHKKDQKEFRIVNNFSSLIRSAREKKNISQEDFAKSINEKESIVAKWEHGDLKPRLSIARKLGKILGLRLIEEDKVVDAELEKKKKADGFTLGDFIKVRKRK